MLLSILWYVNIFLRIIIWILISLTFSVGAFAESGATSWSGTKSITADDTSEEGWDETSEEKKERIKQEISSYIIDSYKAQWDKILKDIDQTLQKTAPDKEDRIEAYKKIRASLEARRQKNMKSLKTSDTSKTIVNEFLNHMIDSIDKKISDLSK